MPRLNALCMSAIASPSVKFPHQPVEIVHKPKPTSLTVNPDQSARTLAHAAESRRWQIFTDVGCAFWKEEPSLRDELFLVDPESIHEICVVPNFISEGYFTQAVVPRQLELNRPTTKR